MKHGLGVCRPSRVL